jgi:formylglycine-generating enzyme required for sulfatase activity
MADSTAATHTEIDSGGGAVVSGGVHTGGGDFVGRDKITNNFINISASDLEQLAERLFGLLTAPGVTLRAGRVTAGGQSIDVPPELVDALHKYLAAAPGKTQAERERQYLGYLCVNPEFHQWQQRYVALSGGYRAVPELTPSYSTILVRGEGPQRQIERVPLADIRMALDKYATLILLAQPGAGKTTVLQRIALDKALARLAEERTALTPLFVRLSDQGVAESPRTFLARIWREAMPGASVDGEAELRDALRQGRLCLLVDALNEARSENYRERMVDWREFAAALPAGNKLVFSCRKLDYNGELAVQQVEIDPLSAAQIEEFALLYLGADKGAAFWSALRNRHADLLELAETPYYLHMLVEVYDGRGDLPPHRARLFEQFVMQLFDREQRKRHPIAWIDPAAQNLALSELAFAMQTLGAGTQVEQEWALEKLPGRVKLPNGRRVETPPADVLALARAASFLAGRSDDKVKFTHHLMQEYFAAEALLRRWAAGEDLSALWKVASSVAEMPSAERGEWDPLPGPPTKGWEETTILAAGLYSALIDAVQPVNPALAARCLLESGAEASEARTVRSQTDLLARLGDVAIHLRSRIEAGLLLGRLGDPRFPLETVNGVKLIVPQMVEIVGGKATIGSGDDDTLADSDEKPRHDLMLATYTIGRYPVTNAEYDCFIKAGGYEEERYWTAGGRYWLRGQPVPGEEDPADWWMRTWQRYKADPTELDRLVASGAMTKRDADNPWRILITWSEERVVAQVREWYPPGVVVREPRYWQDAAFNNLSQPVVGVCWYEAMAYAAWLAASTGQPYRLPSESEWEWAARRGGRIYPWGNGWDTHKLNSLEGENRVMRTTPVGAYPHAATPDGIHDLAGNVREWTATRYAAYPYKPQAALEDPAATGWRIARGGSWAANRKMVRCAYRGRNVPWLWLNGNGFRLARVSL